MVRVPNLRFCELDIEKAYDNVNRKFLLQVLYKMSFRAKWIVWME